MFRTRTVALLVIILLAFGMAGVARFSYVQSTAHKTMTWLLLGVDNHSNRDAFQTDIIVLMQYSRERGVQLMAVPRGLIAYFPTCLKPTEHTLTFNLFSFYELKERPWKIAREDLGRPSALPNFKQCLHEVFHVSIDHYIFVDAQSIINTINAASGVTVNVEKAFSESEHPDYEREGKSCTPPDDYHCRLIPISFEAGLQHMDGARALAYMRSRKNEGDPGATAREGRALQVVKGLLDAPSGGRFRGAFQALRSIYSDASTATLIQLLLDLRTFAPDQIKLINLGRELAEVNGETSLGGIGLSLETRQQIDAMLARHPEWVNTAIPQ